MNKRTINLNYISDKSKRLVTPKPPFLIRLAFIDKILNFRKLRYSSTNTTRNPSWDQIFCSEEECVQRRQVNFLKVFKGF